LSLKSFLMMYKVLLIFVLVFFGRFSFAKEYSFSEKIDLLYQVSPDKDSKAFKTELAIFIKTLRVYDSQAPAKRIKKIFAATQKKYLQNYYHYAFFPGLASENHFNCVTGTALFAIIFDELDIPYHVVEVPQHVYLIAYPDTYSIGIESTSERDGVYTWTEQTKREAVGFLIAIEKVTEAEVELKGYTKIIEDFFYSNTQLNFEELAGIHFINRAIYFSDKKKYTEALEFIRLARTLYHDESLDFLEASILGYRMEETLAEDLKIVDYMTRYYAVLNDKPEKQRTLGNFDFVISEALIKRKDIAFVDSSVALVMQNLKDTTDQYLFLAVVEENKAIWHYNRGKTKDAFIAAEKAYAYNPQNRNLEDLLAAAIIPQLEAMDGEYADVADAMNAFLMKYPFLKEAPRFVNFTVIIYAIMASELFFENEFYEAQKYLLLMESLLNNPEIDLDEISWDVGDAYSEASTYHFRQKNYLEANRLIDLAIQYDPESATHLVRKNYILTKL